MGDSGLFESLASKISAATEKMSVALKKATYKVDRTGRVIRAMSDRDIAGKQIDNLRSSFDMLTGERGQIQQSLKEVTKRLKDKKLSKNERTALLTAQTNLQGRLDKVDSELADNLEARYQAVETYIQTFVDTATSKADAASAGLDRRSRLQAAFGGGSAAATASAKQGILSEQVRGLTLAANIAAAQGRGDKAQEIRDQIAELQTQITEAAIEGINGSVSEAENRAGRREASIGIRERIANALGSTGPLAGIFGDRIASAQQQVADLAQQYNAARNAGFGPLADEISGKIEDLNATIVELTAQRLDTAINQVNEVAARGMRTQDLRGRYASLLERAGNMEGAFASKGSILASRASIMAGQRNSLYGLLGQAQAEGNVGQIEKLTDQIAELDAQLAENAADVRSNTNRRRRARIGAITSRGSFLGGVYGGLGGIFDALGALTGTTDMAGKSSLLGKSGDTLRQSGTGYANQLFSNYGIDIRGLAPADIAQVLGGINYDAAESGMNPEEKATFEGLINSIIENTGAQISNTQQIKQLNSPNTQTWSSTAWQWFRNAIFDGAGGLLPQYQNAGLGVVGVAAGTAMNPTSATRAYAAQNADRSGSSDVFAPVINNEEKTVDMDAETLANTLYFRYRNRPKS